MTSTTHEVPLCQLQHFGIYALSSAADSTWSDIKVRELILEGLFMYQLDSQPSLLFGSTEKAVWKS